jgi:hypothetical protein
MFGSLHDKPVMHFSGREYRIGRTYIKLPGPGMAEQRKHNPAMQCS